MTMVPLGWPATYPFPPPIVQLIFAYRGSCLAESIEAQQFSHMQKIAEKIYELSTWHPLFTLSIEYWLKKFYDADEEAKRADLLSKYHPWLKKCSIQLEPAASFQIQAVVKGEERRGSQPVELIPSLFPSKSYVFYHGKLYRLSFESNAKRSFLPLVLSHYTGVARGDEEILRWNIDPASLKSSWSQERNIVMESQTILWIHDHFPAWSASLPPQGERFSHITPVDFPLPLRQCLRLAPVPVLEKITFAREGAVSEIRLRLLLPFAPLPIGYYDPPAKLPKSSTSAPPLGPHSKPRPLFKWSSLASHFWELFQQQLPIPFAQGKICPEWLLSVGFDEAHSSITISLSSHYLRAKGRGLFLLQALWKMYGLSVFEGQEKAVAPLLQAAEPEIVLPESEILEKEYSLYQGIDNLSDFVGQFYSLKNLDETNLLYGHRFLNFAFWEKIGEGAFGCVYQTEAITPRGKERVVVKVMNKQHHSAYFELERGWLDWSQSEKIPYMVRMCGSFDCSGHPLLGLFALILNYCGEPLYKLVGNKHLLLSSTCLWMEQIFHSLAKCHQLKVVHGDLSYDNIAGQRKHLRILDLGSLRAFPEGTQIVPGKPLASLWVRSPECLLEHDVYGPPADLWAIGCYLAFLFTRKFPFVTDDNKDGVKNMVTLLVGGLGMPPVSVIEKGRKSLEFFTKVGEEYQLINPTPPQTTSLITQAWEALIMQGVDPEVAEKGADLLQRLLTWDPDQRISAAAALQHPFMIRPTETAVLPSPSPSSAPT